MGRHSKGEKEDTDGKRGATFLQHVHTSKGLRYFAETSSAYSMNSSSVFGTISSMFFPAPPNASRAAARSDSSTILYLHMRRHSFRFSFKQSWRHTEVMECTTTEDMTVQMETAPLLPELLSKRVELLLFPTRRPLR